MVEKVKNALPALEDIVDENILDYCTLDKKVPSTLFCAVSLFSCFAGISPSADNYLNMAWWHLV